jgi:hypothetical protein
MNGRIAPVRRLAPTDRRTPVEVRVRACPLDRGCVCCPGFLVGKGYKRHDNCNLDHPASDRRCSPPYPRNLPPCPERDTLSQDPPSGYRPPHHEVCVDCGRVTARRWTDPEGRELAWCAGSFPYPNKIGGRMW